MMQVIMDETHDGGHSVMIDLENDGSLGERGEIGKEDTVKNNSSYSVTCSEGSSLLQSSEEQEPHNESQDGDDNARDHIRDEDDSDNASLVSVTDSTSLGTTNASSGETHATGKTTELPKTCLVSIARFLGFCSLVAGTTFAGMMMKTYASERKDEELEDEFYDMASGLIQSVQHRHLAVLNAMETMSFTALATSRGQSWPFVTLPDFDLWTNRYSIGAKSITLVVFAKDDQREAWSAYSELHADSWHLRQNNAKPIVPYVWKTQGNNSTSLLSAPNDATILEDKWEGVAAISWQSTSPVDSRYLNFNMLSSSSFQSAITLMNTTKSHVQMSALDIPGSTFLLQPILPDERDAVGFLIAQIDLLSYFESEGLFNPSSTPGIVLVAHDTCTRRVVELDLYVGREPRLLDPEEYSSIESQSAMLIDAPMYVSAAEEADGCSAPVLLQVFATEGFVGINGHVNAGIEPPKLAIATGIFVILLGAMCFLAYDFVVRRKQAKLAQSAKKSLAIVNSLFPATVRDRLMEKEETSTFPATKSIHLKRSSTGGGKRKGAAQGGRLQSRIATVFQSMAESVALGNDSVTDDVDSEGTNPARNSLSNSLRRRIASKPIADLFPQVTVLFADIAGFTAWSSVREPSQVFTLLESIFETFDAIAKKHKVFKVETIGDCYVAASGLPDPCANHAIVMCNFARKALHRMGSVVQALETYLGPNTSELSMRIGLHSGPIMAGVLRGEKTRFQLFGDTMNTAARIEATGEKDRIHLSQQTAAHLINAGKGDWVKERETLVTAKGKGELQTYWLTLSEKKSDTGESLGVSALTDCEKSSPAALSFITSETSMNRPSDEAVERQGTSSIPSQLKGDQLRRLIDFNTQVLERFLQKMVAMRQDQALYCPSGKQEKEVQLFPSGISGSVFDEVQESISLPTEPAKYLQNPDNVILSPLVKSQLRAFVTTIASMYRDVPFHCFDHASHVVMSVTKLLARVVTPETIDYRDMRYKIKAGSSALHEYTYGITSDPLTQFAVTFAALIHDVDHSGVPNAQLVKEGDEIAKTYNDKSVAEQHSINLAWDLLMENNYNELRRCIFTTQAELDRFRALLVNAVMATDIADKSLSDLRRRRWEKVFGVDDQLLPSSDQEATNRKATIVIEHLIQASDVAHTMQHWHVYLRWNKLLFHECYWAFLAGRGDNDPSESWYQGELGFFDFYIIPLARKLKECGVFGVASDEYLNYAIANRMEWELKGQAVVDGYRMEFARNLASPPQTAILSRRWRQGEIHKDSPSSGKQGGTKKVTIKE